MKTSDSANPKGVSALVTGGTGFIGSHLVRLLLERGAPRVVATSASGKSGNAEALREMLIHEAAEMRTLDDDIAHRYK